MSLCAECNMLGGNHRETCSQYQRTVALKGDAVVLVNEPFVLDPQAARETVEALKARDATMYRRADLRSRIVLAMSGMDEQQLGVLCEHAERLVPPPVEAPKQPRPADHVASPTERPT